MAWGQSFNLSTVRTTLGNAADGEKVRLEAIMLE
jgi:hypothetical protein